MNTESLLNFELMSAVRTASKLFKSLISGIFTTELRDGDMEDKCM